MISTPFRKKSKFHEKLQCGQDRCRCQNHCRNAPRTPFGRGHFFACFAFFSSSLAFSLFPHVFRKKGGQDHQRKTSPSEERRPFSHQIVGIVPLETPQEHHQKKHMQNTQYNIHKRSPFPFICNPFRKLQNPHDDYSDDNHSHQNDGAFIFRHGLFFCHHPAVLAHFRTQISRNDHDRKTSPNQNGRIIPNKIPCIIIGTASQKYYQCQNLHSMHDRIHV